MTKRTAVMLRRLDRRAPYTTTVTCGPVFPSLWPAAKMAYLDTNNDDIESIDNDSLTVINPPREQPNQLAVYNPEQALQGAMSSFTINPFNPDGHQLDTTTGNHNHIYIENLYVNAPTDPATPSHPTLPSYSYSPPASTPVKTPKAQYYEPHKTSLHIAAEQRDAPKCRKILQTGKVDVNAPDPDGETPLHFAARSSSLKCTRLLIDHGADVNAVGHRYCNSPLALALATGRGDIQAELRAAGAVWEDTALHNAARSGDVKGCERLLERGVLGVDLRNAQGSTPLYVAAESGRLDVVELLIRWGADVNAQSKYDHYYKRPLGIAKARGHHDIAGVLEEQQAVE